MTAKVQVKTKPLWDQHKEKYVEGFQADIYPGDGTDHHGHARTEHEALYLAARHWHLYETTVK